MEGGGCERTCEGDKGKQRKKTRWDGDERENTRSDIVRQAKVQNLEAEAIGVEFSNLRASRRTTCDKKEPRREARAHQGIQMPDDFRVGDVDPASQLAHGYLRGVVELANGVQGKGKEEGEGEGGGGGDRGRAGGARK